MLLQVLRVKKSTAEENEESMIHATFRTNSLSSIVPAPQSILDLSLRRCRRLEYPRGHRLLVEVRHDTLGVSNREIEDRVRCVHSVSRAAYNFLRALFFGIAQGIYEDALPELVGRGVGIYPGIQKLLSPCRRRRDFVLCRRQPGETI